MRITENQIEVAKIIYAKLGCTRKDLSHMRNVLDSLLKRGLVKESAGVLSLSEDLQERIASIMPKGEIVPPYTREFKPLDLNKYPHLRGGESRFVSMSTRVRTPLDMAGEA